MKTMYNLLNSFFRFDIIKSIYKEDFFDDMREDEEKNSGEFRITDHISVVYNCTSLSYPYFSCQLSNVEENHAG